jgi:predicted aspartyl protease
MTVIDRSVADRIGVQSRRPVVAVSTNGAMQADEGIVDELRVANVSMRQLPVLIADLPPFTNHGRLDGILGIDFFEGRSLRFDVRKRCLEIGVDAPAGPPLDAHEIAGRVALETEGLQFVLDSGASFPVLTSARAQALAVRGGVMDLESAAGRRRTATATLPELRIGRIVLRDVAVALVPGTDAGIDGLLPITPFASVYISADRKRVVLR